MSRTKAKEVDEESCKCTECRGRKFEDVGSQPKPQLNIKLTGLDSKPIWREINAELPGSKYREADWFQRGLLLRQVSTCAQCHPVLDLASGFYKCSGCGKRCDDQNAGMYELTQAMVVPSLDDRVAALRREMPPGKPKKTRKVPYRLDGERVD